MTERRLAVFDVDGTIRPGSIVEDAFWELTEIGLFTPDADTTDSLLRRRAERAPDYIYEIVKAYVEAIKGVRVTDIQKFATKFAKESLPELYPEVLEQIELHRGNGDLLGMISGSPDVFIKALAKELGFNASSGSRFYRTARAYHTARLPQDRGTNEVKPIIAQRMALRLGASGICAAYGDSLSDLAMLEIAEHPVAVHPNHELRDIAQNRAWKIID